MLHQFKKSLKNDLATQTDIPYPQTHNNRRSTSVNHLVDLRVVHRKNIDTLDKTKAENQTLNA
jgi:hypothetical protein